MEFNRRKFLKGVGTSLLGIGGYDRLMSSLKPQWEAVLAQPAPRKYALLVGINQYQNRAKLPTLKGCLTDVDLVQNLLIHRFGFNPEDIIVLRNEDATREAIELLFKVHLIDQAQSSDVVFFHFSGFGRYFLPQSELTSPPPKGLLQKQQYGLIPFNAVAAPSSLDKQGQLNAILSDTLYLLLQTLKTERVATVLDTGFHYPGMPILEHSRVRALPAALLNTISPDELAFQEQLLTLAKVKRSQLTERPKNLPPRGLVVTAAYLQQSGIEADWSDFSSGALTYALTQELWHTTPNAVFTTQLSRCSESLAEGFSFTQQPELTGQLTEHKKSTLTRDVMGLPLSLSGDGVVLVAEGKGRSAEVWLGGWLPSLVKQEKNSSYFSLLSPQASDLKPQLLKLTGRRGLTGTVRLLEGEGLKVGESFQEQFRVIGRSQPLCLALSSKLDRVEKVDATSVFSSLGSSVTVMNPDQPADVVLTKIERPLARLKDSRPKDPRPKDPRPKDDPDKLIAGKGLSDPFTADKLTADQELSNPLTAAKLTADTLAANQLITEKSTPDTLTANQLITEKLTPDKLTGDKGLSDPLTTNSEQAAPLDQTFYCLCSTAGDVFPSTLSEKVEAIKNKVLPFRTTFHALQFRKSLDLLRNRTASHLMVSASVLETNEAGERIPLLTKSTHATNKGINTITPNGVPGQILSLSPDTRIQFNLSNSGLVPLYGYLLALDARPKALVMFNSAMDTEEAGSHGKFHPFRIEPGADLTVPSITNDFALFGPPGVGTIYVLFSEQILPLTDMAIGKATQNANKGNMAKWVELNEPYQLAESILNDLHQVSLEHATTAGITNDRAWILSMSFWATLQFSYRLT